MKKIVTLFCTALLFLISTTVFAQTTYTWVGGNGAWNVAGNWSPATVPPNSNLSIVEFNDGGTYTITAVPTQTIRQLLVTNNTNVTLQAATTNTLTINGPTLTNNLVIESGATLQTSATNVLTITMTTTTNQRADISGTLNVRAGTFTTSGVASNLFTVSATGVVNHFGGTITGSATTLNFAANSNYNYLATGALTIPTATWDAASNVNITGITSAATIGGISGQSFGNFNYDCKQQTAVNVNLAATFTVKGDFTVDSTGAGTLFHKISTAALTLTVNGDFNLNNGSRFIQNSAATTGATLTIGGNFNINGGVFNSSTANIACTININGSFNQSGGTFTRTIGTALTTINFTGIGDFTISGGTHTNTLINYNVANGGNLTLQSELAIATTRTVTIAVGGTLNLNGNDVVFANGGSFAANGTLICGTALVRNLAGATTFTLANAATATLSIGSQEGITTTVTGAVGNIRVTGGRTFNLGANYIYTGTNGQVTGNGLLGTITGTVLLDLANDTDGLTFTNATLNGNGVNVRIRSGQVANALSFTNATASTLTYEGIAAQTSTNNEFPATNGPRRLTINNPNGITLHASRALPTNGILTLTEGILTTTATELLTVQNTAVAAVVGGSEISYVNGPLIRAINSVGIYAFPVGDAATYGGYAMQTNSNASVQLRVQFVNSASGGSAGSGLTVLNNYHWLVDRTLGSVSLSFYVTLTKNGLVNDSRVGYATALTGAYTNIGGNNIGTSITSVYTSPVTIDNTNTSAYLTVGSSAALSGTISANNLTEIANVLRTNIVSGNVIFELPTSYISEPAYPVVFTSFAEDGGGPYNVTIRPETGSTNFLTAGAAPSGIPLIDFNDIDRLTIDGRAGGSGGIVWTFRNTNTATTAGATFRFISDATFNTLTYLNIEGQSQANQGNILFSTSVGGTLGNSNNTISHNHIRQRTDNSVSPLNGIASNGTLNILNANNTISSNHIYNNFVAGVTGAGVWLAANNTAWTITDNHFYQTASRAGTGAITRYGIYIVSTASGSDNYTINGNYIGGSEVNAGGSPMTITGNVNHNFTGIHISTNTGATNNIIQNNTIRNIAHNHGALANGVVFAGIRSLNAANTISDNTIENITITEALTSGANIAHGIYVDAGNTLIENNTINNIATGSTGGNIGITGISQLSTGTATIANNTITNLNNIYTGAVATAQVRGIANTAGVKTITGNLIHSLNNNSTSVGFGSNGTVVGISQLSTTAGQTVSQNTIHSLTNSAASAAVQLVGIHFAGATTGAANTISRNNIHSLSLSSSNGGSSIIGINAFSGIATYHNNMIRLGIDAAGNSITNAYAIDGIRHISATANNAYYFNTVYIGGTGVSAGTNNTYAFYRSANTTAINILNNIFINARSNGAGTGRHVSIGFSAAHTAVNLNSNNNLYNAAGTGGAIGMIATTPYDNIVAWQTVISPDDNNSLSGVAGFINPTGTAALVDLHINPATPTQVESGGVAITGFDTDYDGDIRFGSGGYAGLGTAPDIGADEGDFIPTDATPPLIVYTIIPTQTSFTAPSLSATITDNNAVEVSTGLAPRIYFKRSTDANEFNDNTNGTAGWKFVESTTGSSPFAFTLNYALLSGGTGVSAGNTIQYFVVAQDNSSNVAINSGIFDASPSSVALTSAAFPLTGTINSYYINVLNGTYTVGTGGDFTSLTNAGGLFQTINTASLSGNVIAEITSDLTAELGTHALNQWIEIAGSGYTLTIRPSAATTRTISGTLNGDLFRLDGADRVTIDGRFGGSGQYLIFANTSALGGASTFAFLNEATNDTIRYCFLRGSGTSTTKGVVLFGTSSASGSLGNSNNVIEYCDIHQNGSALPTNGIYSAGSASKLNVNNTISNNNIYNFFSAAGGSNGIALAGNTSAWTIENNKFYQEATRTTTTGSTFHYVININNTANASTVIRGNYIGGNSSAGTGTMIYTGAVANQMSAIYLNTNSTVATGTLVENNTIKNIAFTTVSSSGAAGSASMGAFSSIYQLAGASRIIGNTIGAATGNGAITITVNTNGNGAAYGIRYEGASVMRIENNTIGAITIGGGTGTNVGESFYPIAFYRTSGGNAIIKNNSIGSATTANSIQIAATPTALTSNNSILGAISLIGTSASTDSVLFNNIYNLTNFNAGTNTRILGISATSGAQYIIEDNTIRNLSLTASTNIGTTSTPAVLGIALVTANGGVLTLSRNIIHSLSNGGSGASAWTTGIHYNGGTNTSNVVEQNFVHSLSPSSGATASVVGIQLAGGTTTTARNNMVRLGIASNGTAITQSHNIFGIQQTANNIHNIFHNSVYIGGTGVAGALPTFAYHRNQSLITTATNLRNNIFVNNRSNGAGTGVHYAMGFSTAMTTTLTSDNNLFYTNGTGGALGLMGATTYATLADWKTGTSKDAVSLYGDPQFIDATGNVSDVDLHISAIVASPAESNGADVGVTADYDSEDRASRTPTDIGADAGDFLALDIVAPVITYTNATGVCNTSSTHFLNNVTIEDVLSDINVTAGTKPRLYYKKSTDANDVIGWQYVEAIGSTSPFSFNINLTALGTVNTGDIIQYFVVAQDEGPIVFTPNVAINNGSFAATQTSVALGASAFPIGGTLNSFTILPCSGTVTVGTGGAFPSLTNQGGLFEAINLATLGGDLTATIISDLTVETGTHPLNQWAESGVGNYSVTIRPDGNTLRTITGTYAGGNTANAGIYRINGADRFTIDGRDPNNLGAGGRYLLFRNTNATANNNFNSTFNLLNDANNLVFRNLIIEGATVGAVNGVFRIDSEGAGDGNDFITITENQIRDRSDVSGTPNNGIYIIGALNKNNDNIVISNNEIFNTWSNATSSSGILIGSYNNTITISGNHFYQTNTRTATTANITHTGILVSSATGGSNFTVSNNYVGGSAPMATGGPLTNNGVVNATFIGIQVDGNTSSSNTIESNVITNINWSCSNNATSARPGIFTGIYVINGGHNILNNTIGSEVGTSAIVITTTSSNASSFGIAHGGSSGTININENKIGAITLQGSAAAINHNFFGITYGQAGSSSTRTISNNVIGSTVTANSINAINNATGTTLTAAQRVYGIDMTVGANDVIISNNIIANLNNNYIGSHASGQLIGISSPFASNTITNNQVYNLTSSSAVIGTGSGAAIIGINLSATSANNQNVSQNIVHTLKSTASSAAANVIGIYYGSSTSTATNNVTRNLIHSLSSNSAGTASIAGLFMGAGNALVTNNMIRIGIDETGAAITRGHSFNGIHDAAGLNNYYHNSVYVGGSGVASGTTATHAFFSAVGTGTRAIQNNIFWNARSNGAATAKHFSIRTGTQTNLAISHNLLFANGVGGVLGNISGTDNTSLGAFGTGNVSADPEFIDPTGNASNVDLHIKAAPVETPIEAVGTTIAAVTIDIDGDIRADNTPVDLGADAGDFVPADKTAPVITNVTAVANISVACGTTATVNISATITDAGSGVASTPLQPRLWWRLSTGTYAAETPISVSGNTYNYELNLTGLVAGQVYHYYIAAQDNDGNIGYSHSGSGTPVHADVASSPSSINIAPATFSVLTNTPLSGTVTVGTSGNYPRFNGTGGLFEAINTNGLNGNLQVNVISNISELANWTPLTQWQEFCGTGYSVTISPNSATVYTVEANSFAANAMFSFYGVNRLYIDGRFDGAGRYLLLRHNRVTGIYASTVEYNNGAANNVLRNCIIEGANINNSNNTTGSVGVVRIGGSMGFASGNLNNITIQDNEIRNLSNVTPSLTNVPMNLIYLGGANASANINNITITGNDLFNFQTSAIRADNGGTASNSIGNNITISNNNIYQDLIIPTWQYPIVIDAVGNTYGHVISGNKIGGSLKPSPNITGTWQNNKVDGEVVAIYLNVGDATSQAAGTLIDGNTISNITLSGTGYGNFIGIRVENGRVSVNNNTIGSLASSLTAPNIIMAGNGDVFDLTANSMMAGIWTQSTEEVVIDNNIICGLSNTGGLSFFDGIAHGSNLYFNYTAYQTPGGKATITNNQILFNRSGSQLQSLVLSSEAFMGIFCWTNAANNVISGNIVRNCGSNTTIYNRNVRFHGMFVGVYGSTTAQTGIVSNNEISHLFNENPGDNASSTSRNPIIYGMSIANGNWTVSNNTIYLNNGTQGGTLFTERNTSIRGLNDGMLFNQANCQARYYNNTVYVSGANLTGAGQANSTYAFLRFPLDYGSISITAGAPIELRNNIFINDRAGQGNHRAIGNIANTNANASINWNGSASDYNLFSATSTANVALWGASTTYTLANWRTLSSNGDQNTEAIATTTGTSNATNINPSELFLNVGTGAANLRINAVNAPWPLNHVFAKGIPVSVTTDIDGETRDNTTPTRGADEVVNCTAIVISTQPSPNNICEGSNTFFTADASGVGISYQWQVDTGSGFTNITNGAPYANAQTSQLNINNTPESFDGYEYRVVISSTCTTAVNSAAVSLTVNSLPEITVQPANAIVAAGSNTSFGITATGSGTLTYVWQLSTDGGTNWSNAPNSAPYSNVNTATLNISAATAGMNNYQYRVIVNNGCNIPDTSTVAVLTVTVSCTNNTWTGILNNLWEEAGNWSCGIVPDTSINVIIPNVTNDPVISVSVVGGVRDIVIQSSAILTMTDNTILQVSGNFENNGAFDFSGNSTVVLLGNRAQTIKSSWTTGATNSFNNLTIDKANANTVTPTDNIKVNEKTMVEKGELVIAEDIVARSKKVELKDKLLIEAVSGGTKAGEFRVNE